MLTNFFNSTFLAVNLQMGDYIGFTFFIGFMAMMAASVFFFIEGSRVAGKWKTSMLVSALITFIAAAHYWYMRDYWVENQVSPTAFRYIDWILTVPLMCVEFYLILKALGAKTSLLWKMIGYSLVMLIFGYLGETVYRDSSALWGVLSTLGYIGILYEVWAGSAKKLASESSDLILQRAFKTLAWFVLVGWAIYPIGYMAIETDGLLRGVLVVESMDLIYNIGDAVNKIGFGLVIYTLAVASTEREKAKAKEGETVA